MRSIISLIVIGLLSTAADAAQLSGGTALGIGEPVKPSALSEFFAIQPDGATLPAGSGSVAAGKEIFATTCAACHGEKLEGVPGTGAPALIGGRGTLTHVPPVKTVESYWPYATTLFDYVKRAMPFNAPGSLTDDQVYALCAFILAEGKVVPADAVLDAKTLPKVAMPNRAGFRTFYGPDPRLFH
jgi:mono/diheme cytochrome c family protein